MNDVTKQAVLSVTRSLLIMLGSVLATKGVVNAETAEAAIGVVTVVLPAVWGVWDKYQAERKTQEREVAAVKMGADLVRSELAP